MLSKDHGWGLLLHPGTLQPSGAEPGEPELAGSELVLCGAGASSHLLPNPPAALPPAMEMQRLSRVHVRISNQGCG